jgi:hypothetical protein
MALMNDNNTIVFLFLVKFILEFLLLFIQNPESYSNKEFKIGDGAVYDNVKNYALCSKESYIIHIVLYQIVKKINDQNITYKWNILKSIKTNAIYLEERPKNYVMWLTPLLFVILICILLAVLFCRKK